MIYSKYSGNDIALVIENNEEEPYTEIGDKAFLSQRNVRELTLPDTINRIGNWGFAHMKQLRRITIPANFIELGKDVFIDCPELKEIIINPDKSGNPGLSRLFVFVISVFKDAKLFRPDLASGEKSHIEWINQFDQELIRYLYSPDEVGFQSVLIGWFDDEGEDEQLIKYKESRRKIKAEICLTRLKYDKDLEDEYRQKLVEYVVSHIPDGKEADIHTGVWEYVKEEGHKDIGIIKALEKAGGLFDRLRQSLIDHLSTVDADPEVMSYLMAGGSTDNMDTVFDDFEL